jgi:hypothetical protein
MTNEWGQIRNLILRFGWNSTCYQLLNPGFEYWISKDGVLPEFDFRKLCDFRFLLFIHINEA